LEAFFAADRLHRFYFLRCQGVELRVYFGHLRAWRFHAQATHGFVDCVPHPGGTYILCSKAGGLGCSIT